MVKRINIRKQFELNSHISELPMNKTVTYRNYTDLPLILQSSSRVTHQMSSHIFKIILQEVVGYKNVEIKTIEDSFNITPITNTFLTSESAGTCLTR